MTAKGNRRVLTVRLSEPGIAELDRIAARENVDRSTAHRRLLAYATRHMPKGWTPEKP